MKTFLLAFVVLLVVHLVPAPEKKTGMVTSDAATLASDVSKQEATVKVFFVRDMFTVEQRQALWATLENWKREKEIGLPARFLNAGETGGLIDCLGCLTLTKQEAATSNGKHQASFNRLRWDKTGRLVSAWIGFDRGITEPQKLTRLLARMLDAEELLRAGSR
jgi:hypothetical protein